MKSERPKGERVKIECDHCGAMLEVTLQYYTQDNGVTWEKDTPDMIDRNERLCSSCLDAKVKAFDKAADYMSDCAPDWFDPAAAGENWNTEGSYEA